MVYNFLKNKIFIIFCFFILFVCLLFSNVKASNKSFVFNDIKYTLPDSCTDYFIIFEVNNEVFLVWGDTPYWGVRNRSSEGYGIYNYSNNSSYGTFDNRALYNQHYYPMGSVDLSVSPSRYYYKTNWGVCASPGSSTDVIKIIYSSVDIHDDSGSVFYSRNQRTVSYSIKLSTNDNTTGPIVAYSNYFDYTDAKKYECYISTDAKEWKLMNYETFNDTINHTTKFRFNYKIYVNGCYYFKFLNKDTRKENYLSYNITNILKNSSNSGFNSSGIPQPFCTYDRINDKFIIKTQSFTASDMQKYRCFFTKNSSTDYSSWDEMSMGSFNNTLTGETEYYFFFTVDKNSDDCIYYFVFYDNNLKQYGSPSSLNCFFDKMNEYEDSLHPTVSKKENKFTDLLNYFKERFGFLTYPFEFLISFAQRILSINYSDPVIHIPELKEPFGGNVIFNGLDFNFNSLLNNNTFSYIYNIYLIAVDFIVIVLFIFLCKKQIEEVFGNG